MPEELKPIAVVLMSGGMDSAVCAAIAQAEGFEPAALHVNYGQRTQRRELTAFQEIADFYGINMRLVADIGYLAAIGGNSLTDFSIPVSKANLNSREIPNSYVPFRNANILSIAVSWAEVLKASAIYIGAVEEDSSGYPDCRKVFFDAFEQMVSFGTKPDTHISIHTPLIDSSKADIARLGSELGAPLHLTWSCYQSDDLACGECDSCVLRLRGFALAEISDPISYRPNVQRLNF